MTSQYSPSPPNPILAFIQANKIAISGVGLFVALLLVYIFKPSTAATLPSVSSTGMIQPGGTGDSSAGSGTGLTTNTPASPPLIKFSPPADNTNINAGSSAPSVDGASTLSTAVPAIVPNISTAVPAGAATKGILLYGGFNFESPGPLLISPGGRISWTRIARYVDGKHNFIYKSMKVEPGIKIMFVRRDLDAKSVVERRSFAVGEYNVPNIKKWLLSYDRISGAGNLGYGSIGIDAPPRPGATADLYIYVMLDAEWNTAIAKESVGCLAAAGGKEANCGVITPATFAKLYTGAA
jgi:hypothetical protein